jgi:Flp pilus assembly protein TadG
MLRRREVLDEQRGAIMLVMALLLVVLLGVAGFAVDLG